MKTKYAARQGDVLIYQTNQIPKDLDKAKNLILAEGESTGHFHRVTQGKAELFIKASIGLMYLKVLSEFAELSHEEHESIMIPEGDYEIKIQREYDWFNEEVRKVQD